ncbi:DUF899 family protein [Actinoplanes sp. NPDC000266]
MNPEVVSRGEWLTARQRLLVKEKELTKARDRVNAVPQLHVSRRRHQQPAAAHARGTTLAAVSRAPYRVPAISAFLRAGDDVFHTCSTYRRGIEQFHNGYRYLDLTALGRQEDWEEPKGRAPGHAGRRPEHAPARSDQIERRPVRRQICPDCSM